MLNENLHISVTGQIEERAVVDHRYVSRQNGEDARLCGTEQHPCKTIYRALNTTATAIHLHIDGSGTQGNPYRCLNFPKAGWLNKEFKTIIIEAITE